MTVGELKKELSKFPDDFEVNKFYDVQGEYFYSDFEDEVTEIEFDINSKTIILK